MEDSSQGLKNGNPRPNPACGCVLLAPCSVRLLVCLFNWNRLQHLSIWKFTQKSEFLASFGGKRERALATWACRDEQEQRKSVGLLVCFSLPSPLLLVMLSAWVYGHLSWSIPVVNNQTNNSKIKNKLRAGLLCVTWDGKPGALLFTFTLCLPLQHPSAPPPPGPLPAALGGTLELREMTFTAARSQHCTAVALSGFTY